MDAVLIHRRWLRAWQRRTGRPVGARGGRRRSARHASSIVFGKHHTAFVTTLGHQLLMSTGRATHQTGGGRIGVLRQVQIAVCGRPFRDPFDAGMRPERLQTLLQCRRVARAQFLVDRIVGAVEYADQPPGRGLEQSRQRRNDRLAPKTADQFPGQDDPVASLIHRSMPRAGLAIGSCGGCFLYGSMMRARIIPVRGVTRTRMPGPRPSHPPTAVAECRRRR